MPRSLFINLAVAELPRARHFFTNIGFLIEPQFSNDKAMAIKVGDATVMFHTEDSLSADPDNTLRNPSHSHEVLLALQLDNKPEVDQLIDKVVALDGVIHGEVQDFDHVYSRRFKDLDGHIWEAFWMDEQSVAEINEQ